MPGVQLKPQLPHTPVQPGPCTYRAEIGIPIAKRKVISLFFMVFPPVVNSLYRAIMGTLPTNNAIMQADFRLFLLYLHCLHRTSVDAFLTTDAFMLIHMHTSYKGQLAAEIMHQVLHRTHRTEKIAVAPSALSEETENHQPQNACQNKARA